MLISEQNNIVRALLVAAGVGDATEFHIDGCSLLVDGVPHTLEAKPREVEAIDVTNAMDTKPKRVPAPAKASAPAKKAAGKK